MVDIVVHHVTTLELIVDTTVVVHHGKGVSVLVVHDIALSVIDDRRCLARVLGRVAVCTVGIYLALIGVVILVLLVVEEESVVVVIVGINSFVTETIDTAEGITDLHATQYTLILVGKVWIV